MVLVSSPDCQKMTIWVGSSGCMSTQRFSIRVHREEVGANDSSNNIKAQRHTLVLRVVIKPESDQYQQQLLYDIQGGRKSHSAQ